MGLKVILAGHNVDRQALDLRLAGEREEEAGALSPETLSAAYARISRDPRSVDVLRAESRREVDRARRSNQSIIFDMGHASVAEHATFNLDVLGLSRLAVEALERHRLVSFTEKSQRYTRLEGEHVVPQELQGGPLEADFRARVEALGGLYQELARALTAAAEAQDGGGARGRAARRALESRANEDARYALPLCAEAQLGMTVNARSLELIIARLASHELAEARQLGLALHAAVARVAPSVIRYTQATAFSRDTGPALAAQAERLLPARVAAQSPGEPAVRLAGHSPEPDRAVATALLFAHGRAGLEECLAAARALDAAGLRALFAEVYGRMQPWDALPRAWEAVTFTYELVLSAAAYGQLKRHRMSTQLAQPYEPGLGRTIPESVRRAGLTGALERELGRCEELWERAARVSPAAAAYCLTNAHRRRVLVGLNGRALGHFARLRCDAEAQWDIRALAGQMVAAAQAVMPFAGAFYGGKDCVDALRVNAAGASVV
ncbi:MAG TPA: FAD-dependent thymidylate synthase [Myxococcota bacterium]|nr:FAD-dependent thymidylate synthase [Myxococcota bacterium]HRY94941.1 FAD-dependent thymidylate synthase [Myxococcota bacterium]